MEPETVIESMDADVLLVPELTLENKPSTSLWIKRKDWRIIERLNDDTVKEPLPGTRRWKQEYEGTWILPEG